MYMVMSASEKMPNSCWGRYGKVAVVELEPGFRERPSMISERAVGLKEIVAEWRRLNVGSTERCAFQVALAAANELCDELNEEN